MKGDFSRNTFNSKKNFSRVLMQQGRVQLDADWNEQSAILLHYIQTLAADLMGPHAGPGDGFTLDPVKDGDKVTDLTIRPGHYYVDGILCENDGTLNDKPVSYLNQPYYPLGEKEEKLPNFPFLVYLDVWERHITCFEDESLREVALGGVDTTTRAQVVWQVKLRELKRVVEPAKTGCQELPVESNAHLLARNQAAQKLDDLCNIEPDARYRGAENQLYRVEIHTGNIDQNGDLLPEKKATFKWSRENGSVVFPVMSITGSDGATEVKLTNLGRDDKFSLREGDWVEILDDAYTLQNRADNLLQIVSIDRDEMSVSLKGKPKYEVSDNPKNHPLLRRWDQKAGEPKEGGLTLNTEDNAAEFVEGDNPEESVAGVAKPGDGWLKLEDGVEIKFLKHKDKKGHNAYRTGDYWLIPARTATGEVEWPKNSNDKPIPQLPHGIEHHYASLGIVSGTEVVKHCRCGLKLVRDCPK